MPGEDPPQQWEKLRSNGLYYILYNLEKTDVCIDLDHFYAPGLKGPLGKSSNRIVLLSVRNFVPLTNKVQYLRFGWSYSNQT